MIRTVFITLVLAMIFPLALQAQPEVNVTENKVLYQKNVPLVIKRRMPRGGQTRFFGVSKLEPKGELVAFHLYEVKGKNKDAPPTDEELPFSLPNCCLDIFQESVKGGTIKGGINKGGTKSFHLLNTVDFSQVTVRGFKTIGMSLLWLDPLKRTMPILKINTMSPSYNNDAADNLLLVFANGIGAKAALQEVLSVGTDNNGESRQTTFRHVDEKGFLMVRCMQGDSAGSSEWWLQWNGKAFEETKRTTKYSGQ